MSAPEQFQQAAIAMREMAVNVDRIAMLLNDQGEKCQHCQAMRYESWPQKQLREQVSGAAARLREIADVLQRRAHDRDFHTHPPQEGKAP